MELIIYKDKPVYYIDYSGIGETKAQVLQLIKQAEAEYLRQLPKSVLSLTNVANLRYDMDILNAFNEQRRKIAPYEKKSALIGLKGHQRVAYHFIFGPAAQNDFVRIFGSELEAKEWLVSD